MENRKEVDLNRVLAALHLGVEEIKIKVSNDVYSASHSVVLSSVSDSLSSLRIMLNLINELDPDGLYLDSVRAKAEKESRMSSECQRLMDAVRAKMIACNGDVDFEKFYSALEGL